MLPGYLAPRKDVNDVCDVKDPWAREVARHANLGTAQGVGSVLSLREPACSQSGGGNEGCREDGIRTEGCGNGGANLIVCRSHRSRRSHASFASLASHTVAVGTALADRPPHGSRRAALPHRALTLGGDA